MTRDQKIVLSGAASSVAAMILATAGLYHLWPANPALTDIADRLGFALTWNAVAALPLLVTIVVVGNDRFTSTAIDPTLHVEDQATLVNGRVADNTLQQFVLFLVATCALSVNLSAPEMRLIPAASIVFVAARIAFWVGYRIQPLYRAPGMAATGYLNVGLLLGALWKAFVP